MSLSFYIHLSATIQKPSSDISKPSRNTFFTFRTLDHRKQQLEVKEDKIKECLSLTYVLIQVLTSLPSRLHLFQVERRISSGRVGARLGVRVCCVSRGRCVELVISSAQLLDIILEILQKRKAGDQTSVYNTKRPFYDPGQGPNAPGFLWWALLSRHSKTSSCVRCLLWGRLCLRSIHVPLWA